MRQLTSDGHEYEYTWDAWGRLVQIYGLIADAVVSEFEYNGLGWQKSFSEVAPGGGTTTYWNTHDHQGRTLMVRRGTDTASGNPAYKARTVFHNAGRAGSGASSYRNAVVLRDADMTNGWTGAADGTLEARHYYCQNYRGDVVALVTAAGKLAEQVRYDAYGYPTCLPTGDTDSDGDWDATDSANITGGYDIRKDVNLDGTISSADVTDANTINGTTVTLGRGVLSNDTKCHNRPGWQGSEHASATPSRLLHTPYRHHHLVQGRWISRDPAGYVDGLNLYAFGASSPCSANDPLGLACHISTTCILVNESKGVVCTDCEYICTEKGPGSRWDSNFCDPFFGCDKLKQYPVQKASFTHGDRVCYLFDYTSAGGCIENPQGCGGGTPPPPTSGGATDPVLQFPPPIVVAPSCPKTKDQNFYLVGSGHECDGAVAQDCSRSACRTKCDENGDLCENGCEYIKNPIAQAACVTACKLATEACKQFCSDWCDKP